MNRTLRLIAALGWLGLFCTGAGGLVAQDAQAILKSHMRNFAIASLDVKIQIILDAGKSGYKEMGPLYVQAVDYVLDNYSLLETDQRFRQLAVSAIDQIKAVGYSDGRFSVWKLFQTDTSIEVRVSCLNALGVIGKGDKEIVQNLNLWLQSQNTVFQSGKIPDLPVIFACVRALGQIGDSSSFPILFSTSNLGFPEDVGRQAREALAAIPGDLKAMYLDVLQNSPLLEKREALRMALDSNRLSDADKDAIAEFALDVGLHTAATDAQEKAVSREIRFIAVKSLGERKWSKATPLAIEHFDNLLLEYDRGLADRRFLIEAIDALGSMGSHEAAVRLTQYLILLNSYTEKLQEFDGQIVQAVIESLGKLRDKASFDDLMYVQYLSYSGEIKKAARKALENLKW